MKIATWNVERLKHKRSLEQIILTCNEIEADILILTETDSQIKPDYEFSFSTPPLTEIDATYYKTTEHRVTIFSKYPCVMEHDTFDRYTALCVELKTPLGNLLVYGTIMGILGNREKTFHSDLEQQVKDFQRLTDTGLPLCICGDYNLSFADNYYFTQWGRGAVLDSFSHNKIRLLTADVPECIDHIAISQDFLKSDHFNVNEWNKDKKLSDHKGIAIKFPTDLLVNGEKIVSCYKNLA